MQGKKTGTLNVPAWAVEGWDIVQGIWCFLAWEKKAHEILFSFHDAFLKSEMKITLHIFFSNSVALCVRGHTAQSDHFHSQGSVAPPR